MLNVAEDEEDVAKGQLSPHEILKTVEMWILAFLSYQVQVFYYSKRECPASSHNRYFRFLTNDVLKLFHVTSQYLLQEVGQKMSLLQGEAMSGVLSQG